MGAPSPGSAKPLGKWALRGPRDNRNPSLNLRFFSKSWPASPAARSLLPAEPTVLSSSNISSRGSGAFFRTSSAPSLRHFIVASDHSAAFSWKSKPRHSRFRHRRPSAPRARRSRLRSKSSRPYAANLLPDECQKACRNGDPLEALWRRKWVFPLSVSTEVHYIATALPKLIRRRNLISGRDHRPLSIAFTGYHQCPGHAGHLVCERYSRHLGIAEDGQDFFDFVSGPARAVRGEPVHIIKRTETR